MSERLTPPVFDTSPRYPMEWSTADLDARDLERIAELLDAEATRIARAGRYSDATDLLTAARLVRERMEG